MQVSLRTIVTFSAALALIAGCSSGGGQSHASQRAVSSMSEVESQLAKAKTEVDRTVALLNDMEQGKDLSKSFREYSSSVADLKTAGDNARNRGEAMRERRQEYLTKWEQEAAKIQNPDIKEGVEQRRERIRANYDKLSGMAEDVRNAYQPFLRDAQEVQKALSMDLTPAGVNSIRPAIDKAQSEGMALAQKLDALRNEMRTVQGSMATAR